MKKELYTNSQKQKPLFPFFIIGAQRSGTTLLRLMLNMHTKLAIPEESHFIINCINYIGSNDLTKRLTEQEKGAILRSITNTPRFATWNIEKEIAFKKITSEAQTLTEIIDTLYCIKTNVLNHKIRWGDKTPEYTLFAKKLHKLFPLAQFIHIVRDGRDVEKSYQAKGWYGWTTSQRAKHWMQYTKKAEKLGKYLPTSQFVTIHYEDLVIVPESTLKKICNYLEIGYQKEMLEYTKTFGSNITKAEKKSGVHTKLGRLPCKRDAYKWKRKSNKLKILCFEMIAGQQLCNMGYELYYNPKTAHYLYFSKFYNLYAKLIETIYTKYHSSIKNKFHFNQWRIWKYFRRLIHKL